MEKRRRVERDSRQSRSKQFCQEGNDYNSSLRTRSILVTSRRRENDRDITRNECSYSARSTASSRLPQDEYVQRWLAQITPEVDVPSNAGLGSRRGNVPRPFGPEGLSRGFDFEQFLQVKDHDSKKERASAQEKPRKRMLESSSDCSFLERGLSSDPRPETLDTHSVIRGTKIQERPKSRHQRLEVERSVSLEESGDSLSITPRVELFEKRKRHKTRGDRYEPRQELVDPKPQVNRERKREKKRKTKSRGKGLRNAGEDLMRQFSSKSVGRDRLTMRPSHTLGLFKNGRASSPGRRRGLPDLAFSEMEFLRHSKQHPTEMGEEKRLSKSRGKEKRRAERAQNEISEYFKLGAKIRTEVEVPDTLHSVYTNKSGRKLHQGESMNENYQSSYSKSTSQSVDLSKEIFLGLDRRHDFEKLAAMPHSRGKIVQPGVAPNMAMKLSDRDTTYYTWSDSVRSLDVSQSKQKTCSVFSTTPEYIRQMLNDTGIFTNTGIDRNIGRTHKTARKEPVRSKKPTKLLRLSEVPKPISPPMHMQTPSSTKVQSRRAAEARETTLKIHRSSHEVQIRHLDESGSRAKCGWEVLRPAKAIIQHYSPESGWQQHLNDDEAATYSHLSKAKVSGQGISRQVTAQEAYVKHTPTTSGAVRGFDYTKNTTISTRGPEAETSMRHQQQTEQVMYEESSAEMADHRQPLSSGVKQQGGDSCSTGNDGAKCLADPLTNHRQLQSSKAAISDIAAERQVATVLVTDGVPGLSRTLENMPDPPIPYQQAYGAICQVSRTSIVGHVHVAAQAHVSEGLPVRGTQPSRAGGQIFSSHPISSPMIIEPLYKRQLENRISYDLVNQSYNQDVLQDQTLHRFGTPLMEYSHDEGELYDTFEGEYELLNTVENLQEDDGMFSNVADSGARVVEEEEHSPWEMRSRDMSPQAAARQDSYEEAQFAGSSNQRQLPSMDANLSGGGHDRKPSYEPVQELVREEGKEQYNLNRFWRPHRQY